jgi:hypothetical protein
MAMTVDASIGADDPRTRESGIDDETLSEEEARKKRSDGDTAMQDRKPGDLTSEDIARGNDRNTSADSLGRAPKSNRLSDDGIDVGKP